MFKMENASQKLKRIYTKLFANPYIIFLLAFIILVLPSLIRGFDIHGQESYFYYRISNYIINNEIPSYDFLSFGGRAFLYNMGSILFLVLFNLLLKISIINLLVFIPIILGFFSLLLFYLILRDFKVTRTTSSFICYLFILSPVFLYSFTHFTSFPIPLFLNLLGFYFVIKERKIFHYLAFFVYIMLSFFDFIHILFALIIIFFYLWKNKKLNRFIPYSVIILLIIYLNNSFVHFGINIINYKFYEYFSMLGGEYGLSIFLVFMSFFGMAYLWKKKYKNTLYYLFFILNIIILILNIKYIIYITLILSVLGAYGLKYLYQLKWDSIIIRDLTVIMLIAGVIFSGALFLVNSSERNPNSGVYNALIFIEDNTNPRDVILSHEKYGIYINSISSRKNFVDINKAYAPRSELRFYYLKKIFYDKDLSNTLKLFEEFKITYIFITPEMKNSLVWTNRNQGLLYLIDRNPEYFRLIYNQDGVEVWRVL